jgi:hypothetical protein
MEVDIGWDRKSAELGKGRDSMLLGDAIRQHVIRHIECAYWQVVSSLNSGELEKRRGAAVRVFPDGREFVSIVKSQPIVITLVAPALFFWRRRYPLGTMD